MKKSNPLIFLKGILRRPLTFRRTIIAGLVFTLALFIFVGILGILVYLVSQIPSFIPKNYVWIYFVVGFVFFIFLIIVYNLSEEHLIARGRDFLFGIDSDNKLSEHQLIKDITLLVDITRIDQLKNINEQKFDLKKLIEICEELNRCYKEECYLAVAMLTRSLLDHVPPIFGFSDFKQVASNYGGASFKRAMQHLENSSRSIADHHLHSQIRTKEILPNKTQVNFSNDLDVLLEEIVRILQ